MTLRPRKNEIAVLKEPISGVKKHVFNDIEGFEHFQNDFKNSIIKQLLAKGIF
jgi:hypothetical protein